ncbi:MAG: glycosyltransferase [Actinobacteria bacterium]|nr:glycosyltransferase [Actinomycetota bacterium]
MKALFLTSSYPVPEFPQLGIFVREHARAASLHAEVAVAHLDRTPDVRSIHVEDGDDPDFQSVRVRYPASPALVSYVSNVAAALLAYRRLRKRGFEPDVIHAHFFLAGAPAIVLGRLYRKPVVVTEQWSVFLPEDPMRLSAAMTRVARFTYDHADAVMPVSEALRRGIHATGADANFLVVPNVVDPSRFHTDGAVTTSGRLIGVGNLYDAKGWEHLLDAIALLRDRGHTVHLDLYGDGVLRRDLEARASRLGIESLVSFHGWRPKEEVAERLRRSDLFVITSRYDSNPCAVIEALASGAPVVGTSVGGIPEMVDASSGLLAAPGSAESIAAAIETALGRTWDREAIAQSARDRYGLERVGSDFAAVYEDAVARKR